MRAELFDVIIVGGSYAGLSAGMALGRSLRRVLIIDSGLPCNRQTPHSHNFITQDGEKPAVIAAKAREQVLQYHSVMFKNGLVIAGRKTITGFEIELNSGEVLKAGKLIFATGIKDKMPDIEGFADCWGISVIHCPYCHGYEVRGKKTGVLANGDAAFHYAPLLHNLTKDLIVYTNGKSTLTAAQADIFERHGIPVVEKEITHIQQNNGQIKAIAFADGSTAQLEALYARPDFEQHCSIPAALGTKLTEHGLLEVDMFQQTTVPGIYACGDATSLMRSVANAVAAGNLAGAMVNKELASVKFSIDGLVL